MVQSKGGGWTLRGALASGWGAARETGRAVLVIQALAVGLVVAYYQVEWVRAWTDRLGELKAQGGWPAAFVAGFIAGGLVPEAARIVARQRTRLDASVLRQTLFVGLVYGLLGIQIDAFYWLQSVWFGSGTDPATIARKLAVDMLLAAPLVFVPFTVGMFLWREGGFRPSALGRLFTWAVYRDRVLSIQVMNWIVWVPVLVAVYTLPLALQFLLSVVVEACWSLLIVVMARPPGPEREPNPEPGLGDGSLGA